MIRAAYGSVTRARESLTLRAPSFPTTAVDVRDKILWILYAWIGMFTDVFSFWTERVWGYVSTPTKESILRKQLDEAKSYHEWEELSYKLDSILGNDIWRQNPVSRKYDYRLISSRLKELVAARDNRNIELLMDRLRSGLLRNIGSIASTHLYNRAYSGTKLLIEDYINVVIQCLEYVERGGRPLTASASKIPNGGEPPSPRTYNKPMITRQRKLNFFSDTRQSFGSTALVLHGGSLFGLCHIGMIKTLFNQGLLPRIICGSTVGALVASLVCSCVDEEVYETLDNVSSEMSPLRQGYTDIKYHSVAEGVISSMCPPEILIFEQYIREKLGNMTFEEAYQRTGRILNIPVTPKTKPGQVAPPVPTLLNYLSSPNVVVWSAAQCSIGTGIIHKKVELLVKGLDGQLRPYLDANDIEYTPANQAVYADDRESPYTRLSELFNVNNYIVSVARPYFAPILLSDFKYRAAKSFKTRFLKLTRLELQYRLNQLSQWGLVPPMIQQWFVDGNIPAGFQVTVVPELPSLIRDIGKVFDSDNIKEKVDYWIKIGERSVWPVLNIIWARCAIEFVLDDLYHSRRKDELD
uniref:ARAD1D06072p n=1 Tax=Blastobotrys adeninivorans TaxID=409370 RepID=A0A060T8F5_BLAAD